MERILPVHLRAGGRLVFGLLVLAFVTAAPRVAEAQLDPLLIIKRTVPSTTTPQYRTHILMAVDTSLRMQYDGNGTYYDPFNYTVGNTWDTTLAVPGAATKYCRAYKTFQFTGSGSPKFEASTIGVSDCSTATLWSSFYAKSRMGAAKAAIVQAVGENSKSARFGLITMRQGSTPTIASGNDGQVQDDDTGQSTPTDTGLPGYWKVTRGLLSVASPNGNWNAVASSPVAKVQADSSTANTDIVTILNKTLTTSGAILPAGNDTSSQKDAPLANLVSDVKTEATRLIAADSSCRNTIAVLVVGGAEGTFGTAPATSAANLATGFKSISSRRVPIYVIAIAPPTGDVSALQSIATNSGGQYFQVDQSEIDTAAAVGLPPPTLVRGIDTAVQHGMANPSDVNAAPTASLPYGPQSEFQVTSPITGSVNLKGAKDATGATLPNTEVTNTLSGAVIPQRANVLLTSAFALPGFEMKLRAFRVYKPVADTTKAIGYKFASDGTALWTAKTPMADYCNDATASCRNIYTVLPGGTMIAFTAANASTLSPYLNTYDVTGLINFVRTQPLGAILDSTPAFMDPPSLDPPPDSDYPGFAADHEDRRTLIFVGANDGMMHALDGRSGVEVWAYIPFNLLPKLRTLRDGQGIDGYSYFVDGSAKVADVKISGSWRTMVLFGEGPGGTFYQAFDGSLDNMSDSVAPDSDNVSSVLGYFNDPNRLPFLWSFPNFSHFDATINTTATPYGDLSSSASADEKTVGQTWSDPAVGQVKDTSGKYTVITGSGFLPRSVENNPNRAGAPAGRDLYLLDAGDGLALREAGVEPRQRRTRRNRRRLHDDGVWVHEVQERAAGRPGGHRAVRRALHHQVLHRRPRRQYLALRYRQRLEPQPEVHRQPDEAVLGRRGAAGLLVDGCRGRGHAGIHLRGHRQRPAAVHRRERVLHAAWRPRHRLRRHQVIPDRLDEGGRHRRRREGVVIPGGCR